MPDKFPEFKRKEGERLLSLDISEEDKIFLESKGVRVTGTSPANYRIYSSWAKSRCGDASRRAYSRKIEQVEQ